MGEGKGARGEEGLWSAWGFGNTPELVTSELETWDGIRFH